MVSTTSRGPCWRFAPLILLLSSTVYAQYTLRGRIVQEHSITRRAEVDASASGTGKDAPAETSASTESPSDDGGDTGEPGEGTESNSSESGPGTEKQEGEEGNDGGSQDQSGGDGKNDLYLISHEDFCIYGPTEAGTPIAHAGENVVSWCTKDHGTKVIPEGTLKGVTYVKTPNYVQVSGSGNFQNIDIAPTDLGGQLDSSEHTPSGAQLFLGSKETAASSWITIIGPETFCVRACTGDPQYCPTQYDEEGCYFLTQNGVGWDGDFQDCEGEDGDIPGTSQNKDDLTAPAVSNCQSGDTLGAQATSNSSDSASKTEATSTASGSHSASAGTLGAMIPLETCVPCSEASSAAALHNTDAGSSNTSPSPSLTTASPALSGTTEVAVSKIQSDDTLVDGATAIANKPTEAPKSEDTLIQKRQEGKGGKASDDGKIKTRGDQCCFTIWSDSTSTGISGSGAGAAKSIGTGTAKTGAGAGAGNSTDPFRGLSGTATAHATAAGGINGSAHGANDTGNSSDSGAGSWRVDVYRVEGVRKIMGALILGMIGAGWLLM